MGEWPLFLRRHANLAQAVVLPLPCKPTSMMMVGGFGEILSCAVSSPSRLESSSSTTFTTFWAGVSEVRMSAKDSDAAVIDTTDYYAGSLVPQDGTVTPALNESVVKPSFVESSPKAGDAIVVTSVGVRLTVSAKPGLYYTLARSASADGTYEPVEEVKVQAKSGSSFVTFDVEKGAEPAAFFKAEASDR